MNRICCLLTLFVLFSCTCDSVKEEGVVVTLDDPQYAGLIPHDEIVYRIDDSFLPEYDSLEVHYAIYIYGPIVSDTHHDSIRIQRVPYTDSTWFDLLELYGWKQDGKEWRVICTNYFILDAAPEEDRLFLMDLANKIYPSIDASLYYIDDVEWNGCPDTYLRHCGDIMPVLGSIRLR